MAMWAMTMLILLLSTTASQQQLHQPAPAPKLSPSTTIPKSKNATTAPAPAPAVATAPSSVGATAKRKPPIGASAPAPAGAPSPAHQPHQPISNGTLDPSQVAALASLQVPVGTNPCAGAHSTMICDEGTPFRRLLFLQLQYCPADAILNEAALRNLTGLQALSFFDCPMKPAAAIPPQLASTITSFSCVSSLGRSDGFESMQGLPGIWLSKLHAVQDLAVIDVVLNASSLSIVISNMTSLTDLKITNASLKGDLPKTWPANLTSIDLSLNKIQGPLHSFFGELQQLHTMDLTANNISGRIPPSLGRLRSLQKLSLSSNALTGGIPGDTIANLTSLTYIDLSNNQLNGSVPVAFNTLQDLRYLDLRNNQLRGVLPFNSSFIAKLNSLKASGNSMLCYNSTALGSVVSKAIEGVSPCDDTGNPLTVQGPAIAPGDEDLGPTSEPEVGHSKKSKHKGPKTIVWAVATALGAIFLFIALIVIFSKWCRWKEA